LGVPIVPAVSAKQFEADPFSAKQFKADQPQADSGGQPLRLRGNLFKSFNRYAPFKSFKKKTD
jgi:hypothetical protein